LATLFRLGANGEDNTQQRQNQEGKPVREARKVGTSEKVMCLDAAVKVLEADKGSRKRKCSERNQRYNGSGRRHGVVALCGGLPLSLRLSEGLGHTGLEAGAWLCQEGKFF